MNRTFSAPKQWGKDATHDETYAHFGYEVKHESGAGTGCWPNDGNHHAESAGAARGSGAILRPEKENPSRI